MEAPVGVADITDIAAAAAAEVIRVSVSTQDDTWRVDLSREQKVVSFSVSRQTIGALGPRGLLAAEDRASNPSRRQANDLATRSTAAGRPTTVRFGNP